MCEVFFASVAWEVYIGCVERWRYVLETPHQCRSVKGCNAWTSSDIQWFVNTPYKFKSELLCAKHASDAKIKHVDYYLRRKTSKLSRTSQAPFEAMAQRDRAAKSVGRGLYVYFVKRVIKFLVKEYNDFLSLCTTWSDYDLCNKANCANRFLLFNLSITQVKCEHGPNVCDLHLTECSRCSAFVCSDCKHCQECAYIIQNYTEVSLEDAMQEIANFEWNPGKLDAL